MSSTNIHYDFKAMWFIVNKTTPQEYEAQCAFSFEDLNSEKSWYSEIKKKKVFLNILTPLIDHCLVMVKGLA